MNVLELVNVNLVSRHSTFIYMKENWFFSIVKSNCYIVNCYIVKFVGVKHTIYNIYDNLHQPRVCKMYNLTHGVDYRVLLILLGEL